MDRYTVIFDELKKNVDRQPESISLIEETAEIRELSKIVYQVEEQEYCYFSRS